MARGLFLTALFAVSAVACGRNPQTETSTPPTPVPVATPAPETVLAYLADQAITRGEVLSALRDEDGIGPDDGRFSESLVREKLESVLDRSVWIRLARDWAARRGSAAVTATNDYRESICRAGQAQTSGEAGTTTPEAQRPRQRRLVQLYFPYPPDADDVTRDVLRKRARKVLKTMHEAGKSIFDEIRRRDEALDAEVTGGGLGYFVREDVPSEWEGKVFPETKNDHTGDVMPLETVRGFHLVLLGRFWDGGAYNADEVETVKRFERDASDCDTRFVATLRRARASLVRYAPPAAPTQPRAAPDGMAVFAGGTFVIGSTDEEIDARTADCNRLVGPVMGACQREWFADEVMRTVRVSPFYLDEKETTLGEFRAFARATHYPLGAGKGADNALAQGSLSALDAQAYCRFRGKRLPTFEEWEFAARGIERRRYAWGNEEPDGTRANYCDARCDRPWRDSEHDDGYAGVAPPGQYPAGRTPEGLWDMGGNVREWTASTDERGYWFIPGGAWWNARDDLWAADVRALSPWKRMDILGVRCAMDAPT